MAAGPDSGDCGCESRAVPDLLRLIQSNANKIGNSALT
jgi:hypothetical protein